MIGLVLFFGALLTVGLVGWALWRTENNKGTGR
jgi:hypothetical protein